MRPSLVRALLGGAGLLILALLGAQLALAWRTGRPNWYDVTHLLLVLLGLTLLYRAAVPPSRVDRPACASCGSRIHETRRSDDRRRVYTCFACGWEAPVATPRYSPGAQVPQPPRTG